MGQGLDGAAVSVDGVPVVSSSLAPGTLFKANIPSLAPGTHTLKVSKNNSSVTTPLHVGAITIQDAIDFLECYLNSAIPKAQAAGLFANEGVVKSISQPLQSALALLPSDVSLAVLKIEAAARSISAKSGKTINADFANTSASVLVMIAEGLKLGCFVNIHDFQYLTTFNIHIDFADPSKTKGRIGTIQDWDVQASDVPWRTVTATDVGPLVQAVGLSPTQLDAIILRKQFTGASISLHLHWEHEITAEVMRRAIDETVSGYAEIVQQNVTLLTDYNTSFTATTFAFAEFRSCIDSLEDTQLLTDTIPETPNVLYSAAAGSVEDPDVITIP